MFPKKKSIRGLKPNSSSRFETSVKLISLAIAIATLLAGVVQYIKNSEREFRQKIYDAQISAYIETSEIVSVLANTEREDLRSDKYELSRKRFYELKYGKLYLLQDTLVETAFVEFTFLLNRYERKDPKVTIDNLRMKALELNNAFRASLQRTWDVSLPNLKRRKYDIIR